MTVGMVGFGSLLWARHRLRGADGSLLKVPELSAKRAGRTLLLIGGVVAALVALAVTIGLRVHSGGTLSPLSLALPVAGLAWVAVLGLQVLRHRDPASESPSSGDRPSRRPPQREGLAQPTSTSNHPGPPDQHVSA